MYNVLCCSILECGQAWTKPCSCCEQRIGTLGSLSHRTHPAWGPYFTGNYHCNFTSFLNWLLMPFINPSYTVPFRYSYLSYIRINFSKTLCFQIPILFRNPSSFQIRHPYLSDTSTFQITPTFQTPLPFKYPYLSNIHSLYEYVYVYFNAFFFPSVPFSKRCGFFKLAALLQYISPVY